MKNVFTKFFKTTKLLLLVLFIGVLTCVSYTSKDGVIMNTSINKTLDLTAMALKLNEIQYNDKYFALDRFTGDITGYVADCPLCTGYLYCNNQYVVGGPTTYNDKTYGTVNIVASSKNLPCGSIVQFDSPFDKNEKMTAVVLDRGVLGNDLDLLVSSEDIARKTVGRRHSKTYDVLRFGWNR